VNDDEARVLAFPQAPDAIELRHLRTFVAVAEELSFGRAAERLYVTQPALSRQIRALERFIGCELLRRSTHRVELTLAGEALLDRARRLLLDVDEAISVTQSVGDELATRVARLWEPLADVTTADADLQEMRTTYEALLGQFAPPPEVTTRSINAGGVPSFVLMPRPELPVTLLHLHGGGYIMGSAYGFRSLAGALAMAADTGALVTEYRLAPEHPFPAALEDAVRAYVWMIEQGAQPRHCTISGDSAGAGLVLSLLLTLREQGIPLPGATLLLCPSVDLTGETIDERATGAPEMAIIRRLVETVAQAYLAGHPLDDPVVSPLLADLTGLPPMLVQAATGDHVLKDSQLLADRARQHGVDARLELYPSSTHDFHIFWSFLPEAADAVQQAGAFVKATHAADGRDAGRAAS
jgi:acetyl esterase/lipase